MPNRLRGEVCPDDHHEQVDHLVKHGRVKVVDADGKQKLANDV